MDTKLRVNYRRKFIELPVRRLGFFGKISGLMLKTKGTKNFLFDFGRRVSYNFHSLFCFFSFLILWLDEKNNVISWRVVEPFVLQIPSPKSFVKVIEVPLNKENSEIIGFFVGKERFK